MSAHEHRGNATGRVRSLNVGTERENPAPRRVSTGISSSSPSTDPWRSPTPAPGPPTPRSPRGSQATSWAIGPTTAAGSRPSTRSTAPSWTGGSEQLGRPLHDGMFGENLTLESVVDDAVIGELWQIGTARLRVTEPRIPARSPA